LGHGPGGLPRRPPAVEYLIRRPRHGGLRVALPSRPAPAFRDPQPRRGRCPVRSAFSRVPRAPRRWTGFFAVAVTASREAWAAATILGDNSPGWPVPGYVTRPQPEPPIPRGRADLSPFVSPRATPATSSPNFGLLLANAGYPRRGRFRETKILVLVPCTR